MEPTTQYLNMCINAEEVQNIRTNDGLLCLEWGDRYIYLINGQKAITHAMTPSIATEELELSKESTFWIPTLDQLITFFSSGSAIDVFITITDHWRKDATVPYLRKINHDSGHELLIAWFMFQKQRKLWNGQSWEKHKPQE